MAFSKIIPLILIVIIIIVGLLAYKSYMMSSSIFKSIEKVSENSNSTSSPELNTFDSKKGYTISYPSTMQVEKISDYSVHIYKKAPPSSNKITNLIYISVVPRYEVPNVDPSNYTFHESSFGILKDMAVGETKSSTLEENPELNQYYTYKRIEEVTYDKRIFKHYINTNTQNFPAGTKEQRFIHDAGDKIFVMGYFSGSNPTDPYYISDAEANNIFNSIKIEVSTNNKFNAIGFIEGKLCYPSSFIPKGKIEVKNTDTNKVTTIDYEGSDKTKTNTYQVGVPVGKYILRFATLVDDKPFYGYHTDVCKTGNETTCDAKNKRSNEEVEVINNQTTKDIDLCDFYYSEEPNW